MDIMQVYLHMAHTNYSDRVLKENFLT